MPDDIIDAVYDVLLAEPAPAPTPVPYEPDLMEGSIFNEPIIIEDETGRLERPMFSVTDLTPVGDILEGAYSFLEGNNMGTAAAILSMAVPGTIKIGKGQVDEVLDIAAKAKAVKEAEKRVVEEVKDAVTVNFSKEAKDLYEDFLKGKK